MYTIDEFLASSAITMRFREVSLNGANGFFVTGPLAQKHYRCELHGCNGDRPITTTIGCEDGPPEIADVLDAIAAEAAIVEAADSFEEWAVQMGFDPDSRYGERVFRAARRQATRLRALLGDEDYDQLLWQTKRL
jgi:hypothetical protein